MPDTNTIAGGWPSYVQQPVQPIETTFERLGKLLSSVATQGAIVPRSKADVWNQYQRGVETGNQAAVTQEAGDVARESKEMGLPKSRAYYEGERYAEAPILAQQRAESARALAAQRQSAVNRQAYEAASRTGETDLGALTQVYHRLGGTGEFPSEQLGNESPQDLISRGAEGPLAQPRPITIPVRAPLPRNPVESPQTRVRMQYWGEELKSNRDAESNLRKELDSHLMIQKADSSNEPNNQKITSLEAEMRRLNRDRKHILTMMSKVAGAEGETGTSPEDDATRAANSALNVVNSRPQVAPAPAREPSTMTYESREEAQAAIDAGEVQPGDTVIIETPPQ